MAFEPIKETYKDDGLCKLMKAYHEKRKLTDEEQSLEDMYFSELWNRDAYRYGTYKYKGFIFDFSPLFKTYLVNRKYEGWFEIKAPNKTFIRRHASNPSYILRIVELY